MLALRLYGGQDIRLEEIPVPRIDDDEMILKVEAAAICGTDIRMWQNGSHNVSTSNPVVLGHEFAGTVAKVGRNVTFFRKGMRVAVAPNIGCGMCVRCLSGKPHLCAKYQAFGINRDGAFAEYVKIPKEAIIHGNIIPLPKGLSSEEAAVNEPLSCVYNGFLKCDIAVGEYVLVVGAGPIGLMHAMFAQVAGAAKIFLCDLSQDRLLASEKLLGNILVCEPEQLADLVDTETERQGLDVAVIACPSPQMQTSVVRLMNYGGRVNFFGGIPTVKQPVAIDTNLVHYKELVLTGSTRGSTEHFQKTLNFISQGLIDVKKLITSRFDITDILPAFECAVQGNGLKNIITFESVANPSQNLYIDKELASIQ